ncbi:MAG: ABC transporter ATP-binding protein [Verrucomicrobia bacterium]|nr:ABC transporter ATP-binding protein [Verrucomicrobiota bacterium]
MPLRRKPIGIILAVAHLSVRRGKTLILDDLSWQVKRGEHWVILGANGSGKTSLLSALTAYLTPTAGGIELLGQRYGHANWPELRRKIGLVSSSIRQWMAEDEPALQTVVSGKYAMIDYWGKITVSDRRRARRILAQIECGYVADRPWGYLSQGERQRVLIGRALMAEPRVLILDEPCAGLDPAAREHFLQFLDRLGRRSNAPTLILVTHHVEEIMPVFSHVLILKRGQVLAAGSKAEMLNSTLLSNTFDARVRLRNALGRCTIVVAPKARSII